MEENKQKPQKENEKLFRHLLTSWHGYRNTLVAILLHMIPWYENQIYKILSKKTPPAY